MPVFVALNVGVLPLTGLLLVSRKVIVTVDVAEPLARTGPEPIILELAAMAVPPMNTTVPSALATGVAIESVFVSALREDKVQVETPEALEREQAP